MHIQIRLEIAEVSHIFELTTLRCSFWTLGFQKSRWWWRLWFRPQLLHISRMLSLHEFTSLCLDLRRTKKLGRSLRSISTLVAEVCKSRSGLVMQSSQHGFNVDFYDKQIFIRSTHTPIPIQFHAHSHEYWFRLQMFSWVMHKWKKCMFNMSALNATPVKE